MIDSLCILMNFLELFWFLLQKLCFSGGKAVDPLEGSIRVPGIIKWPEKIKAKTVIDHPTSLMDFLPTINEITENKLKSPNQIDGESYFGQLLGKKPM